MGELEWTIENLEQKARYNNAAGIDMQAPGLTKGAVGVNGEVLLSRAGGRPECDHSRYKSASGQLIEALRKPHWSRRPDGNGQCVGSVGSPRLGERPVK